MTSTAFRKSENIPVKYTYQGQNINPPLHIDGIPAAAKSMVLIIDDPDAPMGTFDHWVVWNIPVSSDIFEGSTPGIQGKNSPGKDGYMGPCLLSGTHR